MFDEKDKIIEEFKNFTKMPIFAIKSFIIFLMDKNAKQVKKIKTLNLGHLINKEKNLNFIKFVASSEREKALTAVFSEWMYSCQMEIVLVDNCIGVKRVFISGDEKNTPLCLFMLFPEWNNNVDISEFFCLLSKSMFLDNLTKNMDLEEISEKCKKRDVSAKSNNKTKIDNVIAFPGNGSVH
jgi:hypothetical protein